MKRLFVLGFAIVALGASSFAGSNSSIVDKLNDKTTQKAVARYLGADSQQKGDLSYVFDETSKRFRKEVAKGSDVSVAEQKALQFNLANARVVLSPEQYRKYVTVLNITINNDAQASLLAEK